MAQRQRNGGCALGQLWEDAKKWMQEDKANRLVEGLVLGNGKHEQVLWERFDYTKPMPLEFEWYGGTHRWLNYCTQAIQRGGCLEYALGSMERPVGFERGA